MKMTYNYDAITNTLTMSKAFAKKASQLNTSEYNIVRHLRADNPGMMIKRETEKTKTHRADNISFNRMEIFISQCNNNVERLEEFERVKSLAKAHPSPYNYVKTWFLENYANYAEQPVFDESGCVIVKTKAKMEAEAEVKKVKEEVGAADRVENMENVLKIAG